MMEKWNPNKMDFLLLMQAYDKAVGYTGLRGDFEMNEDGKLN